MLSLSPVAVLEAVESLGFETDARMFPLNSYENRVYQVGLVGKPSIIVKFYRPERWTTRADTRRAQLYSGAGRSRNPSRASD